MIRTERKVSRAEQSRAEQHSERAIEFVVYISSTSALGGEN